MLPAGVTRAINPQLIQSDPARFQFKTGAEPSSGAGTSLKIKGTEKFDPARAGVIHVWADPADGKLYVIDGHNRLDLAKEGNAPEINVKRIDADSAAKAREIGRQLNLGRGNVRPQDQPIQYGTKDMRFASEAQFGIGPGAKTSGTREAINEDLAGLTKRVEEMGRASNPLSQVSAAQRAADLYSDKRDDLTKSLMRAKAVGDAFVHVLRDPPKWTNFDDSIGKWTGAIQKNDMGLYRFTNAIKKTLPDKGVREGITNWIQAGGDENVLRERMEKSSGGLKRGYEAALNLSEDQKAVARNIQAYFDSKLQKAQDAGLLEQGVDNYVTQIWERENPFTREFFRDFHTGKLQPNFKFARQRIFDSYFEGEQAGFKPKDKDIGYLITAYDQAFERALASRAFVKGLMEGTAKDGRPLVSVSGSGMQITGKESDPYLIRNSKPPEATDYQRLDYPALRKWTWVSKDGEGNPIFLQGDLLVHPEIAGHMKNLLGRSWFQQPGTLQAVGRFGLGLSAGFKNTMLDFSGFHQTQLAVHALEHRVKPWGMEDINLEDPKQVSLMNHGLQLFHFDALQNFSEGVSGNSSLYRHIPGVGPKLQQYHDYLFKDYLPRLKMSMALDALDRNMTRYPHLSEDQVLEMTAKQANAAFGGQATQFSKIASNKTFQDMLRLAMLSPDFTISRAKFLGQAFTKYGAEQRQALLLGAVTMYIGARVTNQILNNDPHWDKPFSIVVRGREHKLRTIQGDALNALPSFAPKLGLAGDPRRFLYYRLNPLMKDAIEAFHGQDEFGRNRTLLERGIDTVPLPIAAKGFVSSKDTLLDSMLRAVGVESSKYETPGQRAVATDYYNSLPRKMGTPKPGHKPKDFKGQFKGLTAEDALKDYSRLSDKEKAQVRSILNAKVVRKMEHGDQAEREKLRKLKSAAGLH